MRHVTKCSKKRALRYRVKFFRRRADITAPLRETFAPAHNEYNKIQDALNRGVKKKVAYSVPPHILTLVLRYERARELYDEYTQNIGTLQADEICSIVEPTARKHLVHFLIKSTSDKKELAYTHYRVVVGKHKKSYKITCNCPDFMNHGGAVPCKHVLFACMLLRDKAVVERR
jgi:transcriptional regulatory protein LevR